MQEYSYLKINNNADETNARLVGEKNECLRIAFLCQTNTVI